MSFARYLSKLAALLNSSGQVPPAALSTGAPSWDSSGNVGIGTSSPAAKLQVSSGNIRLSDSYQLEFGGGTNSISGSNASNNLQFYTNNVQRLLIDSSGNVGIGTSSPTQKVDVLGSIAVRASTTGTNQDAVVLRAYNSDVTAYANAIYYGNSQKWCYAGSTVGASLDSSGNLLVGTTSAAGNGMTIYPSGIFNATWSSTGNCLLKNSESTAGASCIDMWRASASGSPVFVYFATEGSYTTRGYLYYDRAAGQTKLAATSDVRLKENIIDAPDALPVIGAIKVRQYDWKETGSTNIGFVAQELHEVVPRAVSVGEDNDDGTIDRPWGVDNGTLVPYLVKAIQEQQAIIEALTQRVAALEA